jgi:hypothetical protein
LSDSLGPADRPCVVAEEIYRLGGDAVANPFVRHLWGVFFVQAFLQYVHQPTFVGGRKLPVARGALDAIGSGMVPPFLSPLLPGWPCHQARTFGILRPDKEGLSRVPSGFFGNPPINDAPA